MPSDPILCPLDDLIHDLKQFADDLPDPWDAGLVQGAVEWLEHFKKKVGS